MDISTFFSSYTNHPVLFIGSGITFRYLRNTYTWDGLLAKVSFELTGSEEFYLDIKSQCNENSIYKYEKIASLLETEFNKQVSKDRHGKFEKINDIFYANMKNNINLSRFKIYITELLSDTQIIDDKSDEIAELKKARKNIGSVITTNYDQFIESIFNFNPLIGNDILLSNPYGSIYKIHGCISDISKIIITEEDYFEFEKKYELIKAQLLSLFIHNPIIFLGYNIGDVNIKKILKTIFTYVEPNTEQAERIRRNFLLVEYDSGSENTHITEHDIDMEGLSTIRINKLKTDNYMAIYRELSNLNPTVSALDVRKVQAVAKEIITGGSIKVFITEDLDDLSNGDKIIAIGSPKTIQYHYMTAQEMIQSYFTIIEESNSALIRLIDSLTIHDTQYFPIFGFSKICPNLESMNRLKSIQKANLERFLSEKCNSYHTTHQSIDAIMEDDAIAKTYKHNYIFLAVFKKQISILDLEKYLKQTPEKKGTYFNRMLCLYDMLKHDID